MAGTVSSSAAAGVAATPAVACADRRPRVAVVGAGFAGLAATLTLQRSGRCDVTLLEASSRAGGRACTLPLASAAAAAGGGALAPAAFELGATWFHGLGTPDAPNPVFKHAVEQGLISTNPQAEKWWSSQFLLPGNEELLTKEQQIGVTHALAAWTEAVEGLASDARGTTAEHLRAAWARLLATGKLSGEQQLEAAGRAWRWREHLQRAMDGCHSTLEQSAQGLALYDEMPGGVHCALPAGMQAVAEGLAKQVGDLRYNHAVQRISWSGGPGGGVTIACSNGATVEADAAIVTVSLGVLKAQHEGMFEPPLPPCKAAAIRRLRIGIVDKLLLDFERPEQAAMNGSSGGGSNDGGSEGDATWRRQQGEAAGTAADPVAAPAPGSAGSTVPAVSYALLWSRPWEGWSSSAGASAGSAGVAKAELAAAAAEVAVEADVPEWARGVFSLRFGGPEVKQPQPEVKQPQPPAASQQLGESEASQDSRPGSKGGSKQQGPEQQDEQKETVAAKDGLLEDAASAGDENEEGDTEEETEEEEEEDEEEEEEEEEFSPCAEAAQPTCYQAVAWVTGEAAAAMEAASDEEVLGTLRQLAAIFPQMQLPPGASWDAVTLHRSRWGSDPLFRGSYSYLGPDCSPADVAALAAPLFPLDSGSSAPHSHPVLLFAGEACHVTYIGTMHGAYLTGQQEAERLLRHWQQLQPPQPPSPPQQHQQAPAAGQA